MPHANPDDAKAYFKARAERLKEHIKELRKAYYLKNSDKIRQRAAAHYAKNRDAINARTRELRAANPDPHRWSNIKNRYGLTADEYDELLRQQGGACAICQNQENARRKACGRSYRLAVDHDHASGVIRGLLCANCNHMIGKAKDSVDVLNRAIAYLTNPPTASGPT